MTNTAKRIQELEAARDSYVLGAPDGTETPNPEGWAEDNADDAAELDALYAQQAAPDRTYATRRVSEREDAFLIAAIRLWQQVQAGTFAIIEANGNPCGLDHFDDITTSFYTIPALSSVEIDDMAVEVFNLDPWLTDEEREAAEV